MTVKEFNKLSIEKKRVNQFLIMPEYLFNKMKEQNFDYTSLLGQWVISEPLPTLLDENV